MDNSNQASSNVPGQIFLDPLSVNFITDGVIPDGQVQQIYQLVPEPYANEQQNFVTAQPVQNKDALPSDTVNLTQLGATMPLTMANGTMTVIESNGQHYIVLPSFTNVTEGNNQIVIGGNVVTGNLSMPQTSQSSIIMPGETQVTVQAQPVDQTAVPPPQPVIENLSIAPSETTIPVKIPCPPNQSTNPMKFHHLSSNGIQAETSTVKSQLKMVDIIPSFFQRTVHQQTEVTHSCKFCKFKAKTLQEMEKHLEEHKKDDTIGKKMKLWKPKKQPKKKKAQMIRTTSLPKIISFPPECPVCQAPIKSLAQHKKHLKLHKGEKPHRCGECSETFNKEHNLNLHKSIHKTLDSSSGEDKYKCPACERSFTRLAVLKMHISLHAEEENFICKECGDEFPTDESLTSHVAEHTIDLARHLHSRQNDIPNSSNDATQITNEATTSEILQQQKTATSKRKIRRSAGKMVGTHHCDQCGRYFQKKSQLTRHLLIHTGEKPHKCEDCGRAFNQKSALRQHLSLHSGEKKFACPHCPHMCRQRGNLNIHIKRVHALEDSNEETFACQYCRCVFKKLGSLNAHLTKFHKQISLSETQMISIENDKVTNEQQTQDEDLENLLNSVIDDNTTGNVGGSQGNQPSATDIVNQAIAKSTDAPQPMPSLLAELNSTDLALSSDTFLAEIERSLPTQNQQVDQSAELMSLLSNSTTPGGTQDYNMCNQVQGMTTIAGPPIVATAGLRIDTGWNFNTGVNRTKNWRTKLRNGIRYHECLFCNKEFRKPSDLQRHIRVHTLERPFKCKQCSKDFTVKSSLNAHIRSHLGLKPYRCLVCHKSFTTAGTLRIHSRIHTGAKPFPCSHCDKRFRTSGQRANHVCLHFRSSNPQPRPRTQKKKSTVEYPNVKLLPPMISTGSGGFKLTKQAPEGANSADKPHTCGECQKQFKRLRTLLLHMKLHTGEKPFKCDQCEKSFVALMYLKAHRKVHEESNKFMCDVCGCKFSTKGSLKRHATKHSNIRPYYCPYCKKTFKTYDACSKHIKCHRKDVMTVMTPITQPTDNAAVNQGPAGSDPGPLPGLDRVEEDLSNTFIQNLPVTDDNTEPSAMKQVDPNMVQNVRLLTQREAPSPQSLVMDIEKDPTNESMLAQQRQGNISGLEYLTDLSVSETPNLLLNQVQNQDTMQFFEFNLTNTMEAANVTPGQPLYVDQLDMITNLPPTSTSTLAPPPAATPAVPSTTKTMSSGSTTRRRGKYHGGKELRYGEQLMYQCMGCETIFNSEEFIDHGKRFSSKRLELTFLCEFCCHRFSRPTHHQSHINFHKVDNPVVVYKCEKCGVGFADNAIREEHRDHFCTPIERTSSNKKLNAMSNKEKVQRAAAKSRSSFIRFTDDQNKILAQTNPNLHMTMSERVLLSAVAEKDRVIETVTQKRGRFKAVDINGTKHKYACKQCPKSFYKNCDLVRHIRTHTGEKPFKCKTCGKSFSVKSCLTSHEKTHIGAKEFRCHICDLMYSSKASLKVHMRLHTGGMPFKCPHCDERFRTSGHRKCHIATHFTTKSRKSSKRVLPPPSTTQPEQNNVIVSDLTLMLPEDVLQGNEPLQLQWNGQNFQVISGTNKFGENLTFQIDPTSLQQAVNNPTMSASQDLRSYTRTTDSTPAPNLVIQPITLPEQGGVQEVNVAVPANLAQFTQMFFQSPTTSTNQQSTSHEPLAADLKSIKPMIGQKEVTLVLTPEELASQSLVPGTSMQHFALDLLNPEDIQQDGQEPFS